MFVSCPHLRPREQDARAPISTNQSRWVSFCSDRQAHCLPTFTRLPELLFDAKNNFYCCCSLFVALPCSPNTSHFSTNCRRLLSLSEPLPPPINLLRERFFRPLSQILCSFSAKELKELKTAISDARASKRVGDAIVLDSRRR